MNKCPDMAHSTAVTAELVPAFFEDFCKLVIDKQEVDSFAKVYESPEIALTKDKDFKCKHLRIDGQKINLPKKR